MYKFVLSYFPRGRTDIHAASVVVEGPSAYDVRGWANANLGTVVGMILVDDDNKATHTATPLAKSAIQLAQEHSQSLLEQGRREGRAEALTIVLEVLATFQRSSPRLFRNGLESLQRGIVRALDVK